MKNTAASTIPDTENGNRIILFGKELVVGKKKAAFKARYREIWNADAENEAVSGDESGFSEKNENGYAEEKVLSDERQAASAEFSNNALENQQKVPAASRPPRTKEHRRSSELSDAELSMQPLDFLDRIAPGAIRFFPDHYIMGNSYRCVWALREFSPITQELALLRDLSNKAGVSLRIYHRQVSAQEQRQIYERAIRRSNVEKSGSNFEKIIEGTADQEDLISMRRDQRMSGDRLLYCTVYLELKAKSPDALKNLEAEVDIELLHGKMNVDRLLLRQREGCLCVAPFGYNLLEQQYSRVLPVKSVANLYPFTYCGKTDKQGFYIGKARYGTNLLVDFDRRDKEHTNGSVLVLGNSGEGKSYLMKILLSTLREAGKSVMILDPESEYRELCAAMGGCDLDLMTGEYLISPLEPRRWTSETSASSQDDEDTDEPAVFRKSGTLDQHISWLRDFFAGYQAEFTSDHLNTLEILLLRLYEKFGITSETDLSALSPRDFPIMQDLFRLCENTLRHYDEGEPELFTKDCLRKLTLGIRSICIGAESAYFNGHTNITDSHFLVFDVSDLLNTNDALKNAMLFNMLSYMSDALLKKGNAALGLDEAYLFLDYPIAVKYLRSFMKRVRKRESSVLIASTHVEDFLVPGVREYTKPLFSTPTHRFLFYPGGIGEREYCEALRVEQSEYELISAPQRGVCLYACGRERYQLEVETQPYRAAMFGNAGGR